jgi:hypothetical protein
VAVQTLTLLVLLQQLLLYIILLLLVGALLGGEEGVVQPAWILIVELRVRVVNSASIQAFFLLFSARAILRSCFFHAQNSSSSSR